MPRMITLIIRTLLTRWSKTKTVDTAVSAQLRWLHDKLVRGSVLNTTGALSIPVLLFQTNLL